MTSDDELSHIMSMSLTTLIALWLLGHTHRGKFVIFDPVKVLSELSVVIRRACNVMELPKTRLREFLRKELLRYADSLDTEATLLSKLGVYYVGIVRKSTDEGGH